MSESLTIEFDRERLTQVYQAKGLTQESLAGLAGVNEKTIFNARAGKRLRLDTARLIAEALETPIDSLVRRRTVPQLESHLNKDWTILPDAGNSFYCELAVRMQNARRVWISGEALSHFFQFEEVRAALTALKEQEDTELRILLLHPESEHVAYQEKQRAAAERDHTGLKAEIELSLRRVEEALGSPERGAACVRLYEWVPTLASYRIDDLVAYIPLGFGQGSQRWPVTVLHNDSRRHEFGAINEHFSSLWKATRQLSQAEFQSLAKAGQN